MRRILAGEADAIIAWKTSRFSRAWPQAEDVEPLLASQQDLLFEEGFDLAWTGIRLPLPMLFVCGRSGASHRLARLGEGTGAVLSKVPTSVCATISPCRRNRIQIARTSDGASLRTRMHSSPSVSRSSSCPTRTCARS